MGLLKKLLKPWGLTDMAVGACLFALTLPLKDFADDPGVGWHLKTGEIIAKTGSIPHFDSFLASPNPRTWVSDQWLSDLFLYRIYHLGSWSLLYTVVLVVFALALLGYLLRNVYILSGSAFGACLALVVNLRLIQVHYILRPVCLAFAFFCVATVSALRLYRTFSRGEEIKQSLSLRRQAILLAILFAVWANVHPSFVMGLIVLWFIPVALVLDCFLFEKNHSSAAFADALKACSFLALTCSIATFVNPYGSTLHASILELGRSEYFMNLHVEWKSPNFRSVEGVFFKISAITIFLALFLAGRAKLKWRSFEFLLLLFFGQQALNAVRMLPFFGIVSAVPLAEALSALGSLEFLQRSIISRRLQLAFTRLSRREVESTNMGSLVLACGLLLILCLSLSKHTVGGFAGPFGPTGVNYPYRAIEFLRHESLSAKRPLVVAANPNWGGFITWFGADRLRPILDDRNTLVGEAFHKKYWGFFSAPSDDHGYFKQFGTDYLLFGAKDAKTAVLRAEGKHRLVFEDSVAAVFRYD